MDAISAKNGGNNRSIITLVSIAAFALIGFKVLFPKGFK